MRRKTGTILAAFVLGCSTWTSAALARPPTLQNSPGYEARLAESRKAWADYQAALQQQQQLLLAPKVPRSHKHRRASQAGTPH